MKRRVLARPTPPSALVFECLIDPAEWTVLRKKLLDLYEPEQDSLRFYFLGKSWRRRVEHHGIETTLDPEGSMIG